MQNLLLATTYPSTPPNSRKAGEFLFRSLKKGFILRVILESADLQRVHHTTIR